jgi:RNA polymerase-binding transcription factor DksA
MQGKLRQELERILRARRAELLREAAACETALQAMAEERESELEEGAQEAQMGRVLDRLDERDRHEITEINVALDRIVDGTYGRCIRCEGAIEIDRLAALPATALCVRCAGALERAHAIAAPAEPHSGDVPADLALLSDVEMEALIRETVEADERIDPEELRISCRRGVVHLEGVLPIESEHTMLRRVVEDVLGFHDVVDRIRIDETPWERADRSKSTRPRPAGVDPLATEDVFESAADVVSLMPADRPTAEEE